jgi:hypothetical protein
MEQIKKLLPDNEIKIDSVSAIAESACRPLISQMRPKLKEALKVLQPLINAIPDNFHATSFEISEASGEIVAAGKNVGGRLVLNATQGAMFSPNGKSSVFTSPKDMGMKLGKENAFNVHHDEDKKDDDGLEEAWQTNFNKGSISTRNSETSVKSAGWVMDRKGEYKVASYPAIDKEGKHKFDLHKPGVGWTGQTSEMGVSEKKMGAKTFIDEVAQSAFGMEASDALKGGITSLETFKEGLPQTMMRFAANEALGAGGLATFQSIRDGKPEVVMDLIGGKVGEVAKALMQTLKDGKPETNLEFSASKTGQASKASMQTLKDGVLETQLNLASGEGVNKAMAGFQTFKAGLPETFSGIKGGVAMFQSFIEDPLAKLSFSGIAGLAMDAYLGANPQAALAIQGGRMLMKSLNGGSFELGDKLKFGGFGGGAIEVGNEIKLQNTLGALVKVGATLQMISADGGNLEVSNIVKIGGRDIVSDILAILNRLNNAGL